MNQKEIGELRRRFKPERSAVSHVYGCFVNCEKEIIADLEESLGMMPQEEVAQYLNLLKKTMSGAQGKNLIDIAFSNQQVMDSDEHRLLMRLRDTKLKDNDARQTLYKTIIDSLEMEGNYLILLAHDVYDVPHKGEDGERDMDASDEVFSYIVCVICPVKDSKAELGYFPTDNEFHCAVSQKVASPELGFMFPAFDDRRANIYNALFYSKKADVLHQEFIDAVFHTEPPMSAAEQRENFQSALVDTLEDECSMKVVKALNVQLSGMIEEHNASKDSDPLSMTAAEIADILIDSGVSEEHADAFCARCDEQFGEHAELNPVNLIEAGRFELTTVHAKVTVEPENCYLVEERIIDGKRYLLIPAEAGIELNGLPIRVERKD